MHARLVIAIGLVVGCNTDSNVAETPGPTPRPTPIAKADEAPRPEQKPIKQVDLSLGDGLEMRRPITSGRLALIPIVTTREVTAQRYITLQDSMQAGLVTVSEISTGYDGFTVDQVRVHNKASEPLAIIAGELITDAHQDRVTAENTVVAAGQTQIIQVRCVEKERDYGGWRFSAGKALAELSLRRVVMTSYQDNVWDRVDQINYRDKTATGTRTYRHAAKLLGTGQAAVARAELVAQLEALEERNHIVGLVVAIDNVPVALERFANPELYRAFEPRLVASYLPETAGTPRGERIAPEAVRAFSRQPAKTSAATHSIYRRL